MADWSGPQWVLATMFAIATLLNVAGPAINEKPVTENIGFVLSRLGSRAAVIGILVWGGFF